MKNFFVIVLLSIGTLAGTTAAAQNHYQGPREIKKEWKTSKKESKIHKKMFTDRGRHADRKMNKAHKKEMKRRWKHDNYR